jgi:hypothetical protein
MKSGHAYVLFTSLLAIAFGGAASAQQPGSVQYNTQVLPANGIVSRSALPDRWGAIAIATDQSDHLGWKDDATSKEEAEAAALELCKSAGATKCKVVGSFANSCAALAIGTDRYGVSYTGVTRRSVAYTKKDAVKHCGFEDCKIVRSGCTVPN